MCWYIIYRYYNIVLVKSAIEISINLFYGKKAVLFCNFEHKTPSAFQSHCVWEQGKISMADNSKSRRLPPKQSRLINSTTGKTNELGLWFRVKCCLKCFKDALECFCWFPYVSFLWSYINSSSTHGSFPCCNGKTLNCTQSWRLCTVSVRKGFSAGCIAKKKVNKEWWVSSLHSGLRNVRTALACV